MKTNSIITLIFLFLSSGFLLPAQPIRNWKTENLKGKVKEVREYRYKAQNKLSKIKAGEFIDSSEYKFDLKGNLVEVTELRFDETYTVKYFYEYDSAGRILVEKIYSNPIESFTKIIYVYDNNGNLTELNEYDSIGTFLGKETFEYDSAGNLIVLYLYGSEKEIFVMNSFTYDSHGNKIEDKIYDIDGQLQTFITYKYDNKGNEVETTISFIYTETEEKITKNYIFDQKDNWTTKFDFFKKNRCVVTIREIEYYK